MTPRKPGDPPGFHHLSGRHLETLGEANGSERSSDCKPVHRTGPDQHRSSRRQTLETTPPVPERAGIADRPVSRRTSLKEYLIHTTNLGDSRRQEKRPESAEADGRSNQLAHRCLVSGYEVENTLFGFHPDKVFVRDRRPRIVEEG